ncbi:hypothetical protein LV84_03315 [Algoriphagus ratkowskyi]|uniref:Outer membrane lipoprotein-sorting protein n=2 Tax=Algoriphagus ratkowskyi TaxID=57028 RepID=A0A2W7QX62_9BACT|nr:hypothetical protein LV84_03315 [Algoriphagus ratkowskyi]TXD76386.1 outer membrane lipoprotein-sorting protein [Algoriphagus ratkowskyi]
MLMNSITKLNVLTLVFLSFLLASCQDKNQKNTENQNRPEFQNMGHELVYEMVQKVGDFSSLADKKSVKYTYTYVTADGGTDISQEKYLFDGEYSYGRYTTHERTLPQFEGDIEQGFNGTEYWLKHNGEVISDEEALARVKFNRPTNYYWFTMMQKLLDPGINYEYIGERPINNKEYHIVKITFDSPDDKPTDTYQLYIDKETSIVDQFLFTVVDFGVEETPYLMLLDYEKIDGLLIPTKRKYKASTWNADLSDEGWITVNWTDIKFDTGITKEDFEK